LILDVGVSRLCTVLLGRQCYLFFESVVVTNFRSIFSRSVFFCVVYFLCQASQIECRFFGAENVPLTPTLNQFKHSLKCGFWMFLIISSII
jgi:hypothetical protein